MKNATHQLVFIWLVYMNIDQGYVIILSHANRSRNDSLHLRKIDHIEIFFMSYPL